MRAVVVENFGEVEDLELGELPDPVPGAGEVLIRVEATSVNFVDLLVIGGKYQFLPERPFAPGKMASGTVVEVGREVTTLKVGDRVQTMAESGGFAELLVVRPDECILLPDFLSFPAAASLSLVFDTSWFALRDRARLKAGETVLVLGATGAVGIAAIKLAKAFGARVLAAISSLKKADAVFAAGADDVIDLSKDNLKDDLRAQVYAKNGGKGADVILDMLGGDVFDAAIRALAWKGRLVIIGFAAGRIPTLKMNYVLLKNIEVSGLQVSDYRKRDMPQMRACFDEVYKLCESGAVSPADAETYPLSGYKEALIKIRDRKASSRIVLLPQQ